MKSRPFVLGVPLHGLVLALALASLAIHRQVRPVLAVAMLSVPSAVVCAIYLGRTDMWLVVLVVTPSVVAASGWGMAVRARR